MENQEKISIIIPVKNGSKYLPNLIKTINKLNYPNYETIFINDGSTDSTQKILEEASTIKLISTEGVGPSAARNLGIQKAEGKYIAFTDADCQVHPEWLNKLKKGFINEKIVAVGGDQLSPKQESVFGKLVQNFLKTVGFVSDYTKKDNIKIIETKHNPTCNAMYLKEPLLEIGGFLEGLWPGEDLELDYRLKRQGWKFYYNPQAIVYHHRPETSKKFSQMMYKYGKSQGFLVKKYGFFRFIHFVPLILIVFLGLLITIGIKNSGFTILSIFLLTFLIFVIKTKNLIMSFKLLYLLILTLFWWNLGFLEEMLIPWKSIYTKR